MTSSTDGVTSFTFNCIIFLILYTRSFTAIDYLKMMVFAASMWVVSGFKFQVTGYGLQVTGFRLIVKNIVSN